MELSDTYNTLLRICESRTSTRIFDDQPVPDELIERIRTIAETSPYASGKKNWEIMVISDKDMLTRMKQVVEERVDFLRKAIRPDMQDQFSSYASNFTFFASAPTVLVPTFRAAPALSLMVPAGLDQSLVQWERDNYVKSISCVSMLILLAAESIGLGACYVTGALIAERELSPLIGLPPGRNIGALIPIGYRTGDTREH